MVKSFKANDIYPRDFSYFLCVGLGMFVSYITSSDPNDITYNLLKFDNSLKNEPKSTGQYPENMMNAHKCSKPEIILIKKTIQQLLGVNNFENCMLILIPLFNTDRPFQKAIINMVQSIFQNSIDEPNNPVFVRTFRDSISKLNKDYDS